MSAGGATRIGARSLIEARHAHVLASVTRRGVVSCEDVWPDARHACGATRIEVKTSLEALVRRGSIEIVVRGGKARATTYRVKTQEKGATDGR